MAYVFKGADTYAQQLAEANAKAEKRRQELEQRRQQLKAIKAAEKQAQKLAAEVAAVEREIIRRGRTPLPEPRYGGRQGLEAAAAEAHGWWKRKQGLPA